MEEGYEELQRLLGHKPSSCTRSLKEREKREERESESESEIEGERARARKKPRENN